MIDTSKIWGAVYHKVVEADLFDYYEVPNFSNTTEKTGTWLETKNIAPLDESMSSSSSETGVYIIDFAIFVPIGTDDAILDAKQLALGELLNPLTQANAYFKDVTLNTSFSIFRVERLGNANYNDNWRQGTVRVTIRKF